MTQSIDDVIAENAPTTSAQPLSRRQLLPFGDMNALNTPTGLNQVGNDLVPALAVLAAQGPLGPKLLTCDGEGRLRNQIQAAAVAHFTAPLPSGQLVATVDDSSSFYVGQTVSLVNNTGPGGTCTDVFINAIPDQNTLVFNGTCAGFNYAIGDLVVGNGRVDISTFGGQVNIRGVIAMLPPGSPNPGDQAYGMTGTVYGHKRLMIDDARSYDLQGWGGRVTGAISSVTFAAPGVGLRNVLAYVIASVSSNVAADFGTFEVWQDAVGTGTQLVGFFLQIEPASNAVVLPMPNLRIKGNDNKPLIARVVNGSATAVVACSAFGYLEG